MPKRTRARPAGVLGGRPHQLPCPEAGCRESVRRETNKPNACRRQEKPGEMLLGHRSYPNAKAHGDQSMIEKQETGELARPVVSQGSRGRVKAALLEPQPPGMELHILRHGRYRRSRRDRTVQFCRPKSPPAGRRPARPLKGTNEGPTSRSDVRLAGTRDRLKAARPKVTERP